MRLFIDVKPTKKFGKTKQESIGRGILSKSFCHNDVASGAYVDANFVYGYNVEKHRKKTIDGKIVYGHWVGYTYKFRKGLLIAFGLRVKQGRRNFKLEGSYE